ncbi:MAG: HPr(Ser) kinase/phosphatase [Oscillospiraceae bacterium]|nr:HPr(Ser) kinase/phosphatase [Oscillospiraceae bacterium]
MPQEFYVGLDVLVKEFELEALYSPSDLSEIHIKNNDVNRPGLQLVGFYEYYDNSRIQIAGKAEFAYLGLYNEEERNEVFNRLFATNPPVFIIAREIDIEPFPEIMSVAAIHKVPVLRSKESTSTFMAKLIAFLNIKLAPRITRHGVLIEVYGEGMLILGDSGVGKSETAIELIKRGHRLIADDAVEIRRTSNITLVGSSPDNIRHFLELRGVGIINARQLFGIGAVKVSEKIDLVVEMELWNPEKVYERMGMDNHYMAILGVKIPHLTIPVKPGRNLAVILEVAAMNNRQKKMGYNAAQELLDNLGLNIEASDTVKDWEHS